MSLRSHVRLRVHEILEVARPSDFTSRFVDWMLSFLVTANIAAVILESVDTLTDTYGDLFEGFEKISVAIFSVEYVLRTWSAAAAGGADCHGREAWRRRLRYMRSPLAIADFASIAPFYLSALLSVDLRVLRMLRLLRILKLTRYSNALKTIGEVIRIEKQALATALLILCMPLIFASSGIHLVEREAQPEAFGSIPAAMWWSVATLTTVGYGDVTPITPWGRVFASVVAIVGVGVVALPTSILASGFAEVHRRNQKRLETEADEAWEDGYLSADESASYAELADELGVSPEFAEEIVNESQRRADRRSSADTCPHCGKNL